MSLLLCLIGLAALLPATSLARTSRPHQGSFGSFPAEQAPKAAAVDQSTGDVYVLSSAFGSGSLSRFTAAGVPDNFTAGPGAGTNRLSSTSNAEDVAVDNSSGPLHGDVYLTEGKQVKIFAADGEPRGSIDLSGTPDGAIEGGNSICGVAVDASSGDVYLAIPVGQTDAANRIWRYAPNSPSGTIDDGDYTVTGIEADQSICRLAVDESKGRLYGVQQNGEDALLAYPTAAFAAAPHQVASTPLDHPVTAVSLDPGTGEVYADEGNGVSVFDSTGAFMYHFGSAAEVGNISAGIAVESSPPGSATAAYVTNPDSGEVDVYGAPDQVPTLTHPQVATLGADGTSAGTFPSPRGLAFDQSARKLYALDAGAPEAGGPFGIYGFDASAPPSFPALPGFAPLATADQDFDSGLAVDNTALSSAGNVYLATKGLIYGFDSAGNPLGGNFPIDAGTVPGPPAGSSEGLCAVAVDSAGDLFVGDRQTNSILEYSAAGAFLAAIDASGQGGSPCSLAFAPNDDLYASTRGGVWRYTVASGYTSASRMQSTRSGDIFPLAVDPTSGHLFIGGIDVDPAIGPLSRTWIDEYDSSGNLLDEFDPGTGPSPITGIAVDPANHDLYLFDSHEDVIRVLGPGVIRPEASAAAPSAITNTSATLSGSVNTQGLSLSDCHFDYVSEAAFHVSGFADLSSGGSAPCDPAAASLPTDLDDHAVSGLATGLTPNVDYRFRLVATNANGASISSNLAFTAAGPPIVETTGSPIRSATTARLDSRVDPRGVATTYHFEYGDQGPCDVNPCTATPPQDAGQGNLTRLVSEQLTGLQPNTTYHYRVVADNANPAGPTHGADMTLTTRASDAPLEHGDLPGPPGSDRAWEQVNIPDTSGNPVTRAQDISDNGDRAVYQVSGGTSLSDAGSTFTQLLAERSATGWKTIAIHPPRTETIGTNWRVPMASGDLSSLFTVNTNGKTEDLWRLSADGSPTRLVAGHVLGDIYVSEDASRVIVSMEGSLDPAHPFAAQPGRFFFYDITSGTPELVGLLPDQSVPACGVVKSGTGNPFADGGYAPRNSHWISPNGELVYFASGGDGNCESGPAELYQRDLAAGTTTLVSPPPLSGPACSAAFIKSVPGAVFFWTVSRLASSDSAPASCAAGDGDVYRYDLASNTVDCITCLVPGLDVDIRKPTEPARNSIAVAGDGSRVYFQSPHHLLPGAPAEGHSSIYRVTTATGALAFVAPGDRAVIGDSPEAGKAITPDGSVLIFRSDNTELNALTGSDNGGTVQYYLYNDQDGSLSCVSCPRDGSAPRAGIAAPLTEPLDAGPNTTPLDAKGDFVFPTPTALVAADQNTAAPGGDAESGTDIYEWRDGQLLLVTDGTTVWPTANPGGLPTPPRVSGITPSGRDVFFTAAAQLTPDAPDAYSRLYDARIGGGFEFPQPKEPCSLEKCQGIPAPTPEDPPSATSGFHGPGNEASPPAHCSKRRKGRCVAKKHKARHHKHVHHRAAGHNRGAHR